MTTRKNTYLCIAATLFVMSCTMTPYKAPSTVANCPNGICTVKDVKPNVAREANYINDTSVAADYKAYGERTPIDRKIGTSGVATNLSSSIPPVLEEEVSLYEEEFSNDKTKMQETIVEEKEVTEEVSSEDPVEDWLAEEGMTLKDLLSQWSEKSGWRLVWKTNRNYTLTAGAMFRARFADASSALVRAFARARPAPIATFYKGNRVLVIETMEDENAYE